MATKITHQTICDLTGDEAVATRVFAVGDRGYEIDLAEGPLQDFELAVARFIASARPAPRGRATNGTRPRPAAKPTADREQNQAIRNWARRNGHPVAGRGRINAKVRAAFNTAHGA